mmetsp:Transcript_36279/g.81963  ORF Transcript_36279/g.81963 Transcript_36279/m.81963 type:complete len:570 (-) Transcript_36279:66-1775(-)
MSRAPAVEPPPYSQLRRDGPLAVDACVLLDGGEVKTVDVLHVGGRQTLDAHQGRNELLIRSMVLEDQVPQHLILRLEQLLQVRRDVAGMARGVHDQAAGKLLPVLELDVHGGGDAVGILAVILRTAVLEGDLLHQGSGLWVEQRVLAVVVRGEHQCLPGLVAGGRDAATVQGLLQHAGDDEGHGVVGRLPCLGVLLRRVPDDAIGGLVRDDVDLLDGIGAGRGQRLVLHQQSDQALEGAGRLVLVEADLEVHAADGEVRAGVREHEVERARARTPPNLVAQGDVDEVLVLGSARCRLEETEDALRVAEYVLGPHKAAHRSSHGEHGRLRGDGGRGPLGVRELFACADGAEGHVVRHSHANGALDLLRCGPEHRAVHGRGGDGAVQDVVDLVALETEHLGKPAADLVEADHRAQGRLAVDLAGNLRGSHDNAIKVVVPELARRVAGDRGVVAEDGAVGVPLADGGGVRDDRLLRRALLGAPEHRRPRGVCVLQGLVAQAAGRVRLHGQSRDTAHDGVRVEHLDPLPHGRVDAVAVLAADEVDRVLGDAKRLVGVCRQGHRRRHRSYWSKP